MNLTVNTTPNPTVNPTANPTVNPTPNPPSNPSSRQNSAPNAASNDVPRALRGLGYGTLTGIGAGVITALTIALVWSVSVLFVDQLDAIGTALGGGLLIAAYGSVVGGVVGGFVGAVLGLIFGAVGWVRQARWITPGLLLLLMLIATNDWIFTEDDPLAILGAAMAAGALAVLGFGAGAGFEWLMNDRGRKQPADPFAGNNFDFPYVGETDVPVTWDSLR